MDVIDMEVRIKQGNEMLDATIEMVDGVMVVSPKVVKFEPKDGDILIGGNRSKDTGNYWIFILKGEIKDEFDGCIFANEYASVEKSGSLEIDSYSDSMKWCRPATEEEKQKLFDKLAEEGYEWNSEKKEVVKKRWKPEYMEKYYFPCMKPDGGKVMSYAKIITYTGDTFDRNITDAGWVFKTKEECQEFCDKLNQAIDSVKL